ncbi:MAG: response regulator [Proteobacteria bacterium]|nr:response regulator [Pseudomonadota bacterium]
MTEGGTFAETPYVFIVESDPDVMYRLSEALKGRDFRVMGLMGGEDLEKSVIRELPDFIVVDIQLTAGDGHQILNQIRSDEKTKHIRIIALTTEEDEDRLWAEGADVILKKPLSPKLLLDALDDLLKKK